jgi:hypothetical protein
MLTVTRTITADLSIGEDRVLHMGVPADFSSGPVRVTLELESDGSKRPLTAAELASSEFVGMWSERTDLPNSPEEFGAWRTDLSERSAP